MPCIMRFCVDRVAYKIGTISVRGGGGAEEVQMTFLIC